MTSRLKPEFEYYLRNQQELGTNFFGQYIVIKNCAVLGAYATELEAIRKTVNEHPLGTFLVQKCDPDPESCVQTFYSRVAI
jgi:hypothetical protein